MARRGVSQVAIRHQNANGVLAGLAQRPAETAEQEGVVLDRFSVKEPGPPHRLRAATNRFLEHSYAMPTLRKGVPHEEWPDPIGKVEPQAIVGPIGIPMGDIVKKSEI